MNRFKSLLSLVIIGAVLSGCSSVHPSGPGRIGLLDRMERSPESRVARASREEPKRQPVATLVSEFKDKGVALQWPLDSVQVTSMFGDRGSTVHEGIDLRAPRGTPVYASESGVVLYAGQRLRGYGKLIVLRHTKGIATVYAHNSKLFVRVGHRVRKGQKIALSGNSGRSSGPHLHFEVRNGIDAIDPWLALPDPRDFRPSRRGLAQSR